MSTWTTATLIVAALTSGRLDDSGDTRPAGPTAETESVLGWCWASLDEAVGLGRDQGQPVFIYLFRSGSQHCQTTYAGALNGPNATAELSNFVCYAADVSTPRGIELVQRYGVTIIPSMLILDAAGAVDDALLGAINESSLVQELRRIARGQGTVSGLRQRLEQDPTNLNARLDYAMKLRHVGNRVEYDKVVESIRKSDPRGRTVVGAQLLLREQAAALLEASSLNGGVLDLTPLMRHLRKVRHRQVLFEGWEWVSQQQRRQGELEASRRSLQEAWRNVADADIERWGRQLVGLYYEDRQELKNGERKFAWDVAKRASELAYQQLSSAGGSRKQPSPDAAVNRRVSETLAALVRALMLNRQRKKALALLDFCDLLVGGEEVEDLANLRNEILADR